MKTLTVLLTCLILITGTSAMAEPDGPTFEAPQADDQRGFVVPSIGGSSDGSPVFDEGQLYVLPDQLAFWAVMVWNDSDENADTNSEAMFVNQLEEMDGKVVFAIRDWEANETRVVGGWLPEKEREVVVYIVYAKYVDLALIATRGTREAGTDPTGSIITYGDFWDNDIENVRDIKSKISKLMGELNKMSNQTHSWTALNFPFNMTSPRHALQKIDLVLEPDTVITKRMQEAKDDSWGGLGKHLPGSGEAKVSPDSDSTRQFHKLFRLQVPLHAVVNTDGDGSLDMVAISRAIEEGSKQVNDVVDEILAANSTFKDIRDIGDEVLEKHLPGDDPTDSFIKSLVRMARFTEQFNITQITYTVNSLSLDKVVNLNFRMSTEDTDMNNSHVSQSAESAITSLADEAIAQTSGPFYSVSTASNGLPVYDEIKIKIILNPDRAVKIDDSPAPNVEFGGNQRIELNDNFDGQPLRGNNYPKYFEVQDR